MVAINMQLLEADQLHDLDRMFALQNHLDLRLPWITTVAEDHAYQPMALAPANHNQGEVSQDAILHVLKQLDQDVDDSGSVFLRGSQQIIESNNNEDGHKDLYCSFQTVRISDEVCDDSRVSGIVPNRNLTRI